MQPLNTELLELATVPSAPAKRTSATQNKKKPANRRATNTFEGLKNIEFFLVAPDARSVKLAADFTDWGKFPIDMIRTENGIWSFTLPLAPGRYLYRFLVDGEWRDDPCPMLRAPNPFGTDNAIMIVT